MRAGTTYLGVMSLRERIHALPLVRNLPPVVSVIRLSGTIAAGTRFPGGVNLASMARAIDLAFSLGRLQAVALIINSPGGSAVQSLLLYRRIRALAQEKDLPVFAFTEDVAASGGYMLALAADEIYANESSIVGSIGVISAGFGFHDLLEKTGIERRIYAAGEHKGMLDPFRPEKKEDVEKLTALQKEVHSVFKDLVRERRADRLKEAEDKLFTGEFWTGIDAEKFGLVDGLGDIRAVMRERYGKNVRLRPVGAARPWWRRTGVFGIGTHRTGPVTLDGVLPANWAGDLVAAIEERALWGRFGL